jgi:hypothetical protein
VSFVAGVEKFTLAIWRDGEDLSFVSGGDVESPVWPECQIPDVFCFGIEENGFFAGPRYAVNLAIGRSADIESAFGVEGDGLRIQVRAA